MIADNEHAHGPCHQRLLTADVVIRHRCDEASCQNPAHTTPCRAAHA
jgi:hypothetical protein